MVENRFQALPETSNRRFSSAEISGTGLICDWQNFWEKKKLIYRNNAMWQVGKRNKDLSRKAPYVSERPHMFQKGPICFKRTPYVWKRDPYVAHMLCFLKDFLPHMLKKLHMLQNRSPYVAHMQPICGPYVSAAVVLLLLFFQLPAYHYFSRHKVFTHWTQPSLHNPRSYHHLFFIGTNSMSDCFQMYVQSTFFLFFFFFNFHMTFF